MLCSVKAQSVLYLTEWTLNEVTFLTCIISVLAINFGFILMVNESLAKCSCVPQITIGLRVR